MGSRAGYITVDWEKLDKDMKEAQNNVHKKLSGRQNRRATKNFMKQVMRLSDSNICFYPDSLDDVKKFTFRGQSRISFHLAVVRHES